MGGEIVFGLNGGGIVKVAIDHMLDCGVLSMANYSWRRC